MCGVSGPRSSAGVLEQKPAKWRMWVLLLLAGFGDLQHSGKQRLHSWTFVSISAATNWCFPFSPSKKTIERRMWRRRRPTWARSFSQFLCTRQSAACAQGRRDSSVREPHLIAFHSSCKLSTSNTGYVFTVMNNRWMRSYVLEIQIIPFLTPVSYLLKDLCPGLDVLFSALSPASIKSAASSPDGKVGLICFAFSRI